MKLDIFLHIFVTHFPVLWNIESWTITATPGEDMLVQYQDLNVSMRELFRQMNFTGAFDFTNLQLSQFLCATNGCADSGKSNNARLMDASCYCDKQCRSLGDCCHDYYARCGQTDSKNNNKKSIRCIKTSSTGYHGYVMIDSCPDQVSDVNLNRFCSTHNITDMMTMLPVTDRSDNVNYKNVFCAACNQVHNYSYWQLSAVCNKANKKSVPTETVQLIKYIKENCNWEYKPKGGLVARFQRCLAVKVRCTSNRIVKSIPVLPELCSFYAMPVCGKTEAKNPHCELCRGATASEITCKKTTVPPSVSTKWTHSSTKISPRGTKITAGQPSINTKQSTTRQPSINTKPQPTTRQPSISTKQISTGKPSINTKQPATRQPSINTKQKPTGQPPINTNQPTTKQPFTLLPYTRWPPPYPTSNMPSLAFTIPGTFPFIHPTRPKVRPTGDRLTSLNILFDFSPTSQRLNVGKKETVVKNKACQKGFIYDPFTRECRQVFSSDVITNTNISLAEGVENCSFIQINASNGVVFPNGTLWVKSHRKAYNKTLYRVNASTIYLCTNFSENYTKKVHVHFWSAQSNLVALSILTYTGGSLSIASLIFLLITYARFQELRTLPGKNVLNLSVALILHHCCFFLVGQTAISGLCKTFAVLLHYFTLASFCWMSVLAFDLWKTFTSKEIISRANSEPSRNRKLFLQYCSYAWGGPAVVVVTCLILETTDVVHIGYGSKNLCWITNGRASLIAFGLPVALILMFNIVTLTWTVIAIYRVRKTTRDVTGRVNQSSVALLYVKLTAVLGFTWLFCLTESFVRHALTTYACNGLNSLQGFFICLVFIVNKRTLDLIMRRRTRTSSHGKQTATSGNIFMSKL